MRCFQVEIKTRESGSFQFESSTEAERGHMERTTSFLLTGACYDKFNYVTNGFKDPDQNQTTPRTEHPPDVTRTTRTGTRFKL